MAPQRHGNLVLLTVERWLAMVVAGTREAVRPKLKHGEGDPQCLHNDLDGSHGGGGPL
jgi:hypothetical protein